MSFRDEPLKVKIYILAVISAAIIFLALNIPNFRGMAREDSKLLFFIFFFLLNIAVDNLDVPLPRGNGSVSVGFAVDLAMIIIFGPAATAWANIGTIVHFKSFKVYRLIYHKILFNAAQLILAAGLSGKAYYLSGGIMEQIRMPNDFMPILASVVTYFFVNTILVVIVMSLTQKVSVIGIWLTNFRWGVPNYLAVAPLGILIAVVFINLEIAGVLLLIIPLMLARHTFIMYMDVRNQYLSTIKALTKAIDAKDHYTHGHSERVARYVVMIGMEMKLPEDFVEKLEYLSLMHDIGKIGIPESILNKPSRLSDEEFAVVMGHAAVGADIIRNIKFIGEYADVVRHHHERMDGRGYPDGIEGDKLSLGARIVGVADAFDAMTSDRVYRKPLTKQEAVEELLRCADTQFCGQVVAAFVKVLRRKGDLKS